jgi:tetratricopeptide (TPR) repeat protein
MADSISTLRARLESATIESERLAALQALAEALINVDPQECLALATESLALAERLEDQSAAADALYLIGSANMFRNVERAKECYERALSLFESLGNRRGIARMRGNIGIWYWIVGEYSKALEQIIMALSLHEEDGHRLNVARGIINIGIIYREIGEYSKALEQDQAALALMEELNNREGIAICAGEIGNVYREIGEYSKALEQFQMALLLFDELGDRRGSAGMMGNIGSAYREIGEYSKALEHHQAALSLFESLGDRRGVANGTGNIGDAYASIGEYSRALEHYQEALSLHEAFGDLSGIIWATSNIGFLYAESTFEGHDPALAEQYLLKAIDLAIKCGGVKRECILAHEALVRLFQQQERWKEAHHHLTKSLEIKEEVQLEEARKEAALAEQRKLIADMEQRRAVEQAQEQAERAALALRTRLLENQLEHQRVELASTALHLAKQTELLGAFRNDLRALVRRTTEPLNALNAIREKLKQLPCESIDWTKFEAEFQATHPEFRAKLIERYPGLTKMEVKICSLLKLKLSSSDIATLFCLSERSVETHRFNIRRKLGLKRGEDLHEALAGI